MKGVGCHDARSPPGFCLLRAVLAPASAFTVAPLTTLVLRPFTLVRMTDPQRLSVQGVIRLSRDASARTRFVACTRRSRSHDAARPAHRGRSASIAKLYPSVPPFVLLCARHFAGDVPEQAKRQNREMAQPACAGRCRNTRQSSEQAVKLL